MTVTVKRLDSQHEFETIKVIRSRVFIEEQGISPDLEIDDFDAAALHAVAYLSGDIVGTGRLIIDNETEARIGRMAVDMRGKDIGPSQGAPRGRPSCRGDSGGYLSRLLSFPNPGAFLCASALWV